MPTRPGGGAPSTIDAARKTWMLPRRMSSITPGNGDHPRHPHPEQTADGRATVQPRGEDRPRQEGEGPEELREGRRVDVGLVLDPTGCRTGRRPRRSRTHARRTSVRSPAPAAHTARSAAKRARYRSVPRSSARRLQLAIGFASRIVHRTKVPCRIHGRQHRLQSPGVDQPLGTHDVLHAGKLPASIH